MCQPEPFKQRSAGQPLPQRAQRVGPVVQRRLRVLRLDLEQVCSRELALLMACSHGPCSYSLYGYGPMNPLSISPAVHDLRGYGLNVVYGLCSYGQHSYGLYASGQVLRLKLKEVRSRGLALLMAHA